jgi:hypothetical protein
MEMECKEICPNLIGFTPPAFTTIAHYYYSIQIKEFKCISKIMIRKHERILKKFKEIQYGGIHRHLAHCGHLATSCNKQALYNMKQNSVR